MLTLNNGLQNVQLYNGVTQFEMPFRLVIYKCEPGCSCTDGFDESVNRGICCGNGKLEGYENCDDGNLNDNDGCDSTCYKEYGFVCTFDSPSICHKPNCGNNVIDAGE